MIEPAEMDEIAAARRRRRDARPFLRRTTAARSRPSSPGASSRCRSSGCASRRIVAIAGGAMKVAAIRAVLASGLLAGLITDERTARAIVDTGPRTKPTATAVTP